jgi:hypothetical protein
MLENNEPNQLDVHGSSDIEDGLANVDLCRTPEHKGKFCIYG